MLMSLKIFTLNSKLEREIFLRQVCRWNIIFVKVTKLFKGMTSVLGNSTKGAKRKSWYVELFLSCQFGIPNYKILPFHHY